MTQLPAISGLNLLGNSAPAAEVAEVEIPEDDEGIEEEPEEGDED